MPLARLLGYYIVLVAAAAALIRYVPAVERAFIAPLHLPVGNDILRDVAVPAMSSRERTLTTALSTLGTLAIVLPVAWVYMFTRKFRYDRALVQSMIILPLVVGGMVMIVKNNLALAFSLAGIVAAVRFRNTLKDPRDAVYIFLALGLGLSAGVQALDISLIMSVTFNLVVLALWKYNFGGVYAAAGRMDLLTMGDPAMRSVRTPEQRRATRATYADDAKKMEADGVLIVQGTDAATTRTAVQAAVTDVAKEWKFIDTAPAPDRGVMLPVLVRFKKKGTPVQLLSTLDEYWSNHVTAAEYIPFNADEEGNEST